MQRMQTVAGLDNGIQSRFEVGDEQRDVAARRTSRRCRRATPLIVFSHSPLYKLLQAVELLDRRRRRGAGASSSRFKRVTVIHGHTHQLLTNRIGNIHFHGMLSTAWPWPYAPEGLPALTVQMNRPDPFDPNDGCGDGAVHRAPRRPGRQGLQPLEPQPDPGHRAPT